MAEVLIVGSGGREHELGRTVMLSPEVEKVYFAPGNGLTRQMPIGENTILSPETFPDDIFTIIGPEAPLVDGLADRLRAQNRLVFGPSAEAAQLEAKKSYAIEFMQDQDIPHPESWIARDLQEATDFVSTLHFENYVIKADGLAGGKGVVLPATMTEAIETVVGMMSGELYDGAGRDCIVFQERLHGPEVSAFVVSDGENFTILPLSQDHKRLRDGDEGPNTGGMGAYAPVPESIVNRGQLGKIYDIAERSIKGMAERGVPYQGVLYIGLMLAEERAGDPVVIEYNVRFGDPETQVVLPVVQAAGFDVYNLLRSAAEGELDPDLRRAATFTHLGRAALTVCLAAEGYPDSPRKGDVIYGLGEGLDNVIIHGGGVVKDSDAFVTAGGRVLYVTGLGTGLNKAAARAYAAIDLDRLGPESGKIGFEGMQYRNDIGHQNSPRQL